MTQKIQAVIMALCIFTLSMCALGWLQPAHAGGVQTYTTQNINVNFAPKVLEIPQVETAIDPSLEAKIVVGNSVMPAAYHLGPEDKIKLTVYGEKGLSGEFKVTSDGSVSLPLIGIVNVLNQSVRDVEIMVADKLREGYLKNPSVSVEVIESRPFYIMGEVHSPGRYSYVHGMNILQAVATSGGFTYWANRRIMDVSRGHDSTVGSVPMSPTELIEPGDTIYVRGRFF